MQSYSQDLRDRVLWALDRGERPRSIARCLEVSEARVSDFIAAYNFARRLKALKDLTPYEYRCKLWTHTPDRFTLNPIHQFAGTKQRSWRLL